MTILVFLFKTTNLCDDFLLLFPKIDYHSGQSLVAFLGSFDFGFQIVKSPLICRNLCGLFSHLLLLLIEGYLAGINLFLQPLHI